MQRIAVIIIRSSDGRLFVHRRADDRKTYPGLFGLGAGGKILDQESPLEGALRELSEETGIVDCPVNELFSFHFADPRVGSLEIFAFEAQSDASITPDPREWQWSGWMSMNEVAELSENEQLCPDTTMIFDRYRLGLRS